MAEGMAAAAAAAYPPWVMLERNISSKIEGSSSIADANTLASCRTTSGHPVNVALCLAAPPEVSRVCVQVPAAAGVKVPYIGGSVLAAHGDSVVIEVRIEIKNRGDLIATNSNEQFVYSAGDAAAEPPRPPSLCLLPPHSITYEDKRRPECNFLDSDSTGLLCRGEGDFLVAELKVEYERHPQTQGDSVRKDAALHLLRSGGSGEWYVKQPVIIRYADGGECVDLASSWQNSVVFPVGDQMLCWVDLYQARGLLFSDDVFGESPSLRYVPLPEAPYLDYRSACRNVCATADGSTVKLVNVCPRCCCGGTGKSDCRASHHAYAVHTWTLRTDDMTWAMDGSLDATQLWALDGYKGLPRVELDNPIVSMDEDEPDAICFVVCEHLHEQHGGDETMWRIMVDMKSKTLGSVFGSPEGWRCLSWWGRPLSSMVSRYFNSKPSSRQPPAGPAAQTEATLNLKNRRVNNKLKAINNMQAASPSPSPDAAILTALQEIPSLGRDELLKAYRILAHDDSGRRFRALMGLPMDMRKDCVLMEIKASEACFLCSACSADLQIKE